MSTNDVRERVEANRKRAMQRLKERGIVNTEQLNAFASRGLQNKRAKASSSKTSEPSCSSAQHPSTSVTSPHRSNPKETGDNSSRRSIPDTLRDAQNQSALKEVVNTGHQDNVSKDVPRPLESIRPSIRKRDYIEYDFSAIQNLNGGYINPEERSSGFDMDDRFDGNEKRQKTLEDWRREQQERRALYDNAPIPEHMSLAPKCMECHVNIEMDPILHSVFKLQVCKSCARELQDKYALLTKTECKEDYFLTDPELEDVKLFHRLEKPNPHSGTFARMQLFVRCEVEEFAYKKWGGPDGLDLEWQRREETKVSRRERKYTRQIKEMRMRTRAQEYTSLLRERKHGRQHVHQFSEPIDGGTDESGHQYSKRRCVDCGLETEEVAI